MRLDFEVFAHQFCHSFCSLLLLGYGLMFCIGIPFSNLAQMVPFIILGVGLDVSFYVVCCFYGNNQS